MFAAYKLFLKERFVDLRARPPVARQQVTPALRPPIVRMRPKPPPVDQETPQRITLRPSPPESEPSPPVSKPRIDPFEDFPAYVDLPPATDISTVGLMGRPRDATLAILTNTEGLALDGEKLVHDKKTVAGLRIGDGLIEFRWMKDVAPDSMAAVRNSILKLEAADDEHCIALRSPVKIKAPVLELASSRFRIYGKCEAPPPPGDVRFMFTISAQLPVKERVGCDIEAMKAGDEVVLTYNFPGDAASKVSVIPSGKVLSAEVATQYVLPSGDVEPLTISRGNRKLKELERLREQSIAASNTISDLRSYRSRLNGQLRQVRYMNTIIPGTSMESPALAGQKATLIASIRDDMQATDQNIGRAELLIAKRPLIEKELVAIDAVAEVAQSLKGTPFPYKFFHVVGDVKVDLVIAE